jgi:hypothetical protein
VEYGWVEFHRGVRGCALGWSGSAAALKQPNNQVIPTEQLAKPVQHAERGDQRAQRREDHARDLPARVRGRLQGAAAQRRLQELLRLVQRRQGPSRPSRTSTRSSAATIRVNTVKKVSILTDPAYQGGEVGFFEAVGNCADIKNPASVLYVFHSEPKHNPDAQNMNPFIHLIVYDMHVAQIGAARSYT